MLDRLQMWLSRLNCMFPDSDDTARMQIRAVHGSSLGDFHATIGVSDSHGLIIYRTGFQDAVRADDCARGLRQLYPPE